MRYDKLESMLQDGSSEPHSLPLEYLRNITNNFSDERLLGEGGFGKVYKEWQLNAPIVHMDLKPANILLDNNMVPKIADFGLSRLFSEEKTWTCTTSRDGTLGYMAPEYINRGIITTKSDIFSLGVIIIEIVTGHRDYPDETGTSSQEFIENIIHNWRNSLKKSPLYTSFEIDCQKIRRCIQIGLLCVKLDRSKRPTTSQIIKMLNELKGAASSNRKEGADAQNAGESSSQRSSGGSLDLASNCAELGSPFSVDATDDPLPSIEGLRVSGEASPGRELQASGYPINGTTTCNFQWVRHLEDGSVNFIEGARMPSYLVTADDVGALLAVEVQPLDNMKRKGDLFKVYVNQQTKITCDPETKELIKRTLETGHVTYEVQVQIPEVRFLHLWEPAVLEIKRKGYRIKCNGKYCAVNVASVKIPFGYPTEFSITSVKGVEYNLKPAGNTPTRDTIVLLLRLFNNMDADAQNAGKSSSRRSSPGSLDLASNYAEPGSPFSEDAMDDPLPGIEGLCVTGEPFPGRVLQASGYSVNGTTTCNFEWVRHLEDGSVNFIEGAKMPSYLVTADDVGALLAVEAEPLDDRKRKGDIQKVYANEQRKITCDPEVMEHIKKTLEIGHVTYKVQVQLPEVRLRDLWEPAVLAIKREGYSIKCNDRAVVVIAEKFQHATAVNIPSNRPTEFSITSVEGVEYNLKPAENTLSL